VDLDVELNVDLGVYLDLGVDLAADFGVVVDFGVSFDLLFSSYQSRSVRLALESPDYSQPLKRTTPPRGSSLATV